MIGDGRFGFFQKEEEESLSNRLNASFFLFLEKGLSAVIDHLEVKVDDFWFPDVIL